MSEVNVRHNGPLIADPLNRDRVELLLQLTSMGQ